MQVISSLGCILFALGWLGSSQTEAPTPVEIWRRGDDALTRQFEKELEQVFKLSPYFRLSSGSGAGTWLVRISDHIVWKRSWRGRRAEYRIEFKTIDGKLLGVSQGSCPEDKLRRCALDALKDAEQLKGGGK